MLSIPHPRVFVYGIFFILLIALLWGGGVYVGWEIDEVMETAKSHKWQGAFVYVSFLASSVFLAPLSSLPLLPFAAEIWGIAMGTALSVLGWWLGAMIAFMLARLLGRPLLERLTPLDTLTRWEQSLPADITFWGIVILRLILPVEIPSFALAFIKSLSFRIYALATLVGIIPFAFLWVAFGRAVFAQNWVLVTVIGLILVLATYITYRLRKLHLNQSNDDS